MPKPQKQDSHRALDKVRIRTGAYKGARGVIQTQRDDLLDVGLSTGETILFAPYEITNYSLAARRAWASMPKRAGRPEAVTARKKMVSLRIDIDLWKRLGEAVAAGIIPSREQAVNDWIRRRLEEYSGDIASKNDKG